MWIYEMLWHHNCLIPLSSTAECLTGAFSGDIWDEPATWKSCSIPRTSSAGPVWRGGGRSEMVALACLRLLSNCVCGHLGNEKRRREQSGVERECYSGVSGGWPLGPRCRKANHQVVTETWWTSAAERKQPKAECNHSHWTCSDSPLGMSLTAPIVLEAWQR